MMSITSKQVISTVKEIALGNPGHQYTSPDKITGECRYLHDNEPGCIFGHAFVRLGFSIGDIRECEGLTAYGAMRHLGISVEAGDWEWCDRVQRAQDDGGSWGVVITV